MFIYNETSKNLTLYACKKDFCFRDKHVPRVKNNISASRSRLQLKRLKILAPLADKVMCNRVYSVGFIW